MLSIEERQAEFDKAYKEYLDTGSKEAWHTMFIRVSDACSNIAKRLMIGKPYNPMTEQRALDAAIIVMDRLKRLRYYPVTLSSYCYLPTYKELFDMKSVRYDRLECISDSWVYNNAEYANEEINEESNDQLEIYYREHYNEYDD